MYNKEGYPLAFKLNIGSGGVTETHLVLKSISRAR